VRPGERRGRSGEAGDGVDALWQQPERSGRTAQIGHQAQRGLAVVSGANLPPRFAIVFERQGGERPGRPGGWRRPGVFTSTPILGWNESESTASLGDQSSQRPPHRRKEGRQRKGSHCPGRGRVEAGGRIACRADQPVRHFELRCDVSALPGMVRPRAVGGDSQPCEGRSDRVAKVLAGIALLIVGLAPPRPPIPPRRSPAARAAAANQPAASPCAPRPGTGAPVPRKRAAALRSRRARKRTIRRALRV
jgi:hypothetical protein